MLPKRENLPTELVELKQVICWFEERRENKATKVPSAPWKTGHWGAASATDPANWVDFDTAVRYASQRNYGVGFCLREGGGVVGFDLDNCIGNDEVVNEFASELVHRANSYTEISPSGHGIRIIAKGKLPGAIRNRERGIEVYDRDRFLTLTGKRCTQTPSALADVSTLLEELYKQYGEETIEIKFIDKRSEGRVPITAVVPMGGLRKRGKQFQGPHPVHGSETGMNFSVNPEKNAWFCYRHWVGGGPISWMAVQEGLVECEEVGRGIPTDGFRKAVKLAQARGLIPERTEERIHPNEIANELMKTYIFKTMRDTEEVFVYRDGVYEPYGEALIKAECECIMEEKGEEQYCTTHFVNEVIGHVQRSTYVDRREFEKDPWLLAVENGVLNLRTHELLPHSPEHMLMIKIPVKYDLSADCPRIKCFFREVVREGDVALLEEAFGYCLYRGYPIQVAVLFIGDRSNGKSTTLVLLCVFLGKQNCSGVPLHELLTNRFAPAELYGKLANTFADLPSGSLRNTGMFKALTGGDLIKGERKFKNPFYFYNHAKLLFSANRAPPSEDKSGAFYRRWLIVDFPNVFEGKRDDKRILEKLTTPQELSGLLNLALEGLKRLMERGGFSRTETVDAVAERYERLSDQVAAFVADRCEAGPDKVAEKEGLYNEFVQYCQGGRVPVLTQKSFTEQLKKQVAIEDHRPGPKAKRCWKGIGLKIVIKETKQLQLKNLG